jgi:hypothetical protein
MRSSSIVQTYGDWVITLTLLAHNLRRNDTSLKELSLRSLRCRIHRHMFKLGIAKRRVTQVHNTHYDQGVKQQYIAYINDQIKIGRYCPHDIISIDETNFDFDQTS